MVHDRANWRMKVLACRSGAGRGCMALACLDGPAAHAQSIMRSPNINIGARIPSIDREHRRQGGYRTRTGRSPRLRPGCSGAYRDSDGGCSDQPVTSTDGGTAVRRIGPRPEPKQWPAPQCRADALDLRTVAGRNRGRDRRLAVRRSGRRTGAASRPGASGIAEFSADRRHHRPVPHHRPPLGRRRQAANSPPRPAFARCSRTSVICCRSRRRH